MARPWVVLLGMAALLGVSQPAFAQFGTASGGDIYWAQSNGNPTSEANPGSSSDAAGFSVDGLWNDTASTGYPSPNNVPAGSFPSINWSTSSAGTPVPASIPGTYSGTSPNATDPGFIPGSPGNTNIDIVFDASDGYNSPTDVRINYSPSVQGIYINNIGTATALTTDTATDPQTITLGTDGITVTNAVGPGVGAAGILIGQTTVGSTHYSTLTLSLLGSQTWLNNSGTAGGSSKTSALQITSPIVLDPSVTSPIKLTLSAPGPLSTTTANTNALLGTITDNTTTGGTLAIEVASGEWQLSGANSFTGGFTLDSGAWLKMVTPTGIGSITATITVPSGATFTPATSASNTTYTNPLIISGIGVTAPGGTSGNSTFGAIASMNSSLTNSSDSANSNTLSGGITLAGNALIEASNNPLKITTNPVNLAGNVLTLSGIASSRAITVSSAINDSVGGGGVIVDSQSAATNVTTLSGNNTYTGQTFVEAGILALSTSGNNNIPNSASVNVASGATLQLTGVTGSGGFQLASGQTLMGEGIVTGTLAALAGSHLDPGNGPGNIGTLTTAALTLNSGSILDVEFISTPANDFIKAAGNSLTINGGGVNLFQPDGVTAFDTPGTYDLISYSGAVLGSGVTSLSVLNPQPGFTYTFGVDASHANDVDVTIAPVPEPSSLILLALGGMTLAGLAFGRRPAPRPAEEGCG